MKTNKQIKKTKGSLFGIYLGSHHTGCHLTSPAREHLMQGGKFPGFSGNLKLMNPLRKETL